MNFTIKEKSTFFCLNKLDKFLEGHDGFIAGGCFKNLFNNEPIRDIDIFFKTEDEYKSALDLFNKKMSYGEYSKLYENDNCVAFTHKKTKIQVELIKKRFGTPQQILEIFDFSIVKVALCKEGSEYKLMYVDRFFEDLHQKKLVIDIDFDKIPLPVNTFDRAFKYQRYGYSLCRESKIKLIESLRNLQGEIDLNRSLYFGID